MNKHLIIGFSALLAPFLLVSGYSAPDPYYQFYVHGFEQSRRFRALKVWFSFRRYGADEIGRWIDRNIEHVEQPMSLPARMPPSNA